MLNQGNTITNAEIIRQKLKTEDELDVSKKKVISVLKNDLDLSYRNAKKL